MPKFLKNTSYFSFIAGYMLICALWGSTSQVPMFFKNWKLFDTWAPFQHNYHDLLFEVEDSGGQIQFLYALKSAKLLQKQGIDTVRLTNLLTEQFDYKEFDLEQTLKDFKAKCDCRNIKLIKKTGPLSDHILFNKRSDDETVREL